MKILGPAWQEIRLCSLCHPQENQLLQSRAQAGQLERRRWGSSCPGLAQRPPLFPHYFPMVKSGQHIHILCEVPGTRASPPSPPAPALGICLPLGGHTFINLTPVVQATTAAWETLIYIASDCQAWQIEATAPLGTEQGSKSSFFPRGGSL